MNDENSELKWKLVSNWNGFAAFDWSGIEDPIDPKNICNQTVKFERKKYTREYAEKWVKKMNGIKEKKILLEGGLKLINVNELENYEINKRGANGK